jgi:YVTN family beta-propeller protein
MRPLAVLSFLVLGPTTAQAAVLVVLNKSDHEAVLVDPASLRVLARVPTGKGPHEVAISPDGARAYVTNYGVYGLFRDGEPSREPGNTLTVIDLGKRAVVDTFDLGTNSQPHGVWVSRDGSRVWVTCEGAQTVLELDARSGAIRKTWETAQDVSHMLVPTPNEAKLYIANIRSGSVTVIDRRSDQVRSIATGAGAEGIDVSPDGREVWVANRGANTISVLDVASDSVVATLSSAGEFPIRAKFTPIGDQVWVSNARSNHVAIFDARSRKHLAAVDVGVMPIGILIEPAGKRAFIANTNSNQITVIDVPGRKVLRTFTTGNEPDGMAWGVR